MLAPAELPPMTPPRASTAWKARSVRVPAYESTRFHWRPPLNHTPVAPSSTAAKASVSATLGSWVCSRCTLVSPRARHGASTAESP